MYRATYLRLIGLCALLLLGACERRQHLVEQHLLEFGTIIEITMISDDLQRAQTLLAEIEQRLQRQRQHWHPWEDSDLSRFNQSLQHDPNTEIPPSLVHLLQLSRDYYDASDGLFNPALGKLIAAYGFHGPAADTELITRIRSDLPDMTDLRVQGNTANSQNPNLQIDLGGIAKGYTIGQIAEFLDASNIEHYVINAGGDLVVSGDRFGRPWRVGIQNPYAPGAFASIELSGKHSLFTSGNYARRHQIGDRFRHHIIDPRSGESSAGQSSATVLARDPTLADVAATVLMIDGSRQHQSLGKALAIDNYLIVTEDRKVLISHALAGKVRLQTNWPLTIID